MTADNPPDSNSQIIDQLCSEYRKNLMRKLQECDYSSPRPPKNSVVLGINALIAEHFYNHGYYLSQSVFSSEIELPVKAEILQENSTYRLKQSDIEEVFTALGLSFEPYEMTNLIDRYNAATGTSLIATLFQQWTRNRREPKKATTTNQSDLIAFNKYLKILVSRIAKVSLILNELKRKRRELTKPRRSGGKSRQNSEIEELAKKIEKLTGKLTELKNVDGGVKVKEKEGLSYNDWIRELKNSRHGRRMIRKIERIIVNSLNKEQKAMQKNFDEKLDTQKMILKLHYKQKFLEHFQALNLSSEPLLAKVPLKSSPPRGRRRTKSHRPTSKCGRRKSVQSSAEEPLKTTEDDEKENRVPLSTGKAPMKLKEEQNKVQGGETEETEKEKKTRLKNVQRLINDAKDRIKLLQEENERLDQSFNTYLERQSSQTVHFQKDVSAIWDSYNVDKLLLEKRRETQSKETLKIPIERKNKIPEIRIQKSQNGAGEKSSNSMEVKIEGSSTEIPAASTTIIKDNSSGEFSNPFINFDVKQFLESTVAPRPRPTIENKSD